MREAHRLSALARGGRTLSTGCFALLCLRFIVAAFHESGGFPWPTLALTAGGLGLGWWRPGSALFAFTVAVPLLCGLVQTTLVGAIAPVFLLFSAMWLGIQAGRLTEGKPLTPTLGTFPSIAVDLLTYALLVSLAVQLWENQRIPGGIPLLSTRTVHGFGEPAYFLTSAFIWLQGLFYFRELCVISCNSALSARNSALGHPGDWVHPGFAIYGVTMGCFILFEHFLRIPTGWAGSGFQSPYEDISSLGSIAVALAIFAATMLRKSSGLKLSFTFALLVGTASLTIASWSRGAWLSGIIFLLLLAWCRLPKKWFMALIAAGACAVILINVTASQSIWQRNIYLTRLIQLVRVEGIASKSAGRLELWHKAAALIQENPLMGHGIGSFYLKSPLYALPNDPYAKVPDFAHNTLLQIAAEQGIPIALLFAGLCGWTLWVGVRTWLQDKNRRLNPSKHSLLVLGVTLALGAYVQTQMTANSLNVYVSNQFFFWFLMAALLALTQPPAPIPANQQLRPA